MAIKWKQVWAKAAMWHHLNRIRSGSDSPPADGRSQKTALSEHLVNNETVRA